MRLRVTLVDFYTKYGLDEKISDVERMISDERWKGREEVLFENLACKYEKTIAGYEKEYGRCANTYESDEEDDAPTQDQREQIECEVKYSTKAWTRFINLTRELKRLAFLPKCRKNGNLYGPSEGYTRCFNARNQHIIENGWHHRHATRRAAEIVLNVSQ